VCELSSVSRLLCAAPDITLIFIFVSASYPRRRRAFFFAMDRVAALKKGHESRERGGSGGGEAKGRKIPRIEANALPHAWKVSPVMFNAGLVLCTNAILPLAAS